MCVAASCLQAGSMPAGHAAMLQCSARCCGPIMLWQSMTRTPGKRRKDEGAGVALHLPSRLIAACTLVSPGVRRAAGCPSSVREKTVPLSIMCR